jgi:hypothetical protein
MYELQRRTSACPIVLVRICCGTFFFSDFFLLFYTLTLSRSRHLLCFLSSFRALAGSLAVALFLTVVVCIYS